MLINDKVNWHLVLIKTFKQNILFIYLGYKSLDKNMPYFMGIIYLIKCYFLTLQTDVVEVCKSVQTHTDAIFTARVWVGTRGGVIARAMKFAG